MSRTKPILAQETQLPLTRPNYVDINLLCQSEVARGSLRRNSVGSAGIAAIAGVSSRLNLTR
jgi:hypothetical protein